LNAANGRQKIKTSREGMDEGIKAKIEPTNNGQNNKPQYVGRVKFRNTKKTDLLRSESNSKSVYNLKR